MGHGLVLPCPNRCRSGNPEGHDRLESKRNEFEIADKGIRCVSDRPWVTTAGNLRMRYGIHRCRSRTATASSFFTKFKITEIRGEDTLRALSIRKMFHSLKMEYSTYSAAAVILAADAILGITPAKNIFTDHGFLPSDKRIAAN